MGTEAINGDICYLQLLPSFGLIRFYLNMNIKKKLREQPCIWAWISCVKIICKTIYNNTVRLSMSMWPQEKSLFKIFSVRVNANHPFSSKLTILTISRKSLFLVHILGGLWIGRGPLPLIFEPMVSPCHDYHKIELSSSSQQILLLIWKCKQLLYKGPVAQKEDYLSNEDKYL